MVFRVNWIECKNCRKINFSLNAERNGGNKDDESLVAVLNFRLMNEIRRQL